MKSRLIGVFATFLLLCGLAVHAEVIDRVLAIVNGVANGELFRCKHLHCGRWIGWREMSKRDQPM